MPFELVEEAAAKWKKALEGVEKPWLCWNMNNRWCVLQQKLVAETGWTPVVGWDPNCGMACPELIPEAVAIDFNEILQLPVLFVHVPLEFAFLWVEKLAFWHADMILPRDRMRKAADMFERLKQGEMTAVKSYGGLRNIFRFSHHRYWEVLGCTTRDASKDQFEKGCGWWRNNVYHQNISPGSKEQLLLKKYYDDHGVGIQIWKKHYGGKVHTIREGWIADGHFSAITCPNYIKGKSKSEEMDLNFDLDKIARDFGIDDLL